MSWGETAPGPVERENLNVIRRLCTVRGTVRLALLAGVVVSLSVPGTALGAEEEKPYTAVDGKVDKGTYNGYRRYHNTCHVCHGPDGLGSSFGPALVESVKQMTYGEFAEVVVNGRRSTVGGKESVMPAFAENRDVMYYLEDFWAYLKARADGALGRGRPGKLWVKEN